LVQILLAIEWTGPGYLSFKCCAWFEVDLVWIPDQERGRSSGHNARTYASSLGRTTRRVLAIKLSALESSHGTHRPE